MEERRKRRRRKRRQMGLKRRRRTSSRIVGRLVWRMVSWFGCRRRNKRRRTVFVFTIGNVKKLPVMTIAGNDALVPTDKWKIVSKVARCCILTLVVVIRGFERTIGVVTMLDGRADRKGEILGISLASHHFRRGSIRHGNLWDGFRILVR